VTERGEPPPEKHTFRAPATASTAVAAIGVDAVSAVDDHALDDGLTGLADTLVAASRFSRRTSAAPPAAGPSPARDGDVRARREG